MQPYRIAMRIASFNLENLDDRAGLEPSLSDRIEILRPQLMRLRADILCLQEVNAQKPPGQDGREGGADGETRTLAALDRLLAGTEYQDFHRATSTRRDGQGPMDVQNVVIVSRLPLAWHRQYWHDFIPPPQAVMTTAVPPDGARQDICWDRPVLHAAIRLDDGRLLHVFNLHLRAPLAAIIPGQKEAPFVWKSVPGWAEGFYLAAMKRTGQALETRIAVDRVLESDRQALILVCGDMNADARETPLRILRGEEDDTGNGALAGRVLVPVERVIPEQRRYSTVHAGQLLMVDHLLASRALINHVTGAEIHNEALEDEVTGYALVHRSPESYHAPVVAEFDL
jgi:endonuclease/exonuclease/phosphatase family metal-dependent hydrolase